MPNIQSAIKRAKQSEARRKVNLARKSSVKTAIKKVLAALKANEDVKVTKELLRDAEAKLARAKSKRVIQAGTAQRTISRLAKKVAAIQKSAQAK
jgi:small subunit ribosomal protein S20